MFWQVSRFRAGDLVWVRSREEILATLDEHGAVDGLPFMPEMLQYCGQSFRVSAVAHKTCETARKTWKARRLERTVHLAAPRCDGSAHGGCQADCNLFWKDVWLTLPGEEGSRLATRKCDEATLVAATQSTARQTECAPQYSCQATRITDATAPLAWWDPRQYVLDVLTRNHSLWHVARVLWLSLLWHALQYAPTAYRLVKSFRASMHRRLMGWEVPDVEGAIRAGERTPTGHLGLMPGERVRVKAKDDIARTLGHDKKNRGLSFDAEMVPYCGRDFTVRRVVTQIIDEDTGRCA